MADVMTTDQIDTAEEFRDSARNFLKRADHRERRRIATLPDRAVWREMGEAGWLLILIPEELGGLGLGLREAAAIAEEIGVALLPEPYLAGGVLPGLTLSGLLQRQAGSLASNGQAASLLERLGAGELLTTLAWQARAGQLEAEAAGVTCIEQDGTMVLNGERVFVFSAPEADGWLVLATQNSAPCLVWISVDAPGVTSTHATQVDGTAGAMLTLRSVPIDAAQVLGRGPAVLEAVQAALEATRIVQAGELLGVARQTLAMTLEYMKTRVQFGKPIGSFQALQHRMVDAFMQIELGAASLADSCAAHDDGRAPAAQLASRVKARAASAALHVTRLAIQMHGAIGYTDEYDVGLYFKRAVQLSAWLGNTSAHRQRFVQYGIPQTAQKPANAWQGDDFPREADWEAMSEADFRGLVRAFFAKHYPENLRHQPFRLHWKEIGDWYKSVARQGWIAPAWPRVFGGMALPPDKLIAFIEEQEQYGVGRAPDQGLVMLGPILIRYGTPEQQARWLPPILSGEHVWAQGYSEPNAGSDLASLRTEAVLENDEFVVTGQKTWSTLAQDATHMFMLVRTDKTVKKQEGISFLMVDLTAPGVTVRPIRTLGGDAEFAEVFFDRVRVPRDHLVGELNKGWGIAKTLLGFERLFSGSPKHSQYALMQVVILAQARGLMDDAAFRDRLAGLQLDAADLSCAYGHFADMVKQGKTLPAEVSLLKIWATETHERIANLLLEIAAEHGAADPHTAHPDAPVHVLAPLLSALAASIFSGSNEIQRNILAKTVLGLPG